MRLRSRRQAIGDWRVRLALWLLLGGAVAYWFVERPLGGAYLDILGLVMAVATLVAASYYIMRF